MRFCEDGHKKVHFTSHQCPACELRKQAEIQVHDAQKETLEARLIIGDLEERIRILEKQLQNRRV